MKTDKTNSFMLYSLIYALLTHLCFIYALFMLYLCFIYALYFVTLIIHLFLFDCQSRLPEDNNLKTLPLFKKYRTFLLLIK